MTNKLFLFAAGVMILPGICRADSLLGVAGAYNLVALGATGNTPIAGNIATTADVTGRIAAANMVLDGTTIGSAFQNGGASDPSGFAGAYALVAGNGVASGTTFNINGGGNVYNPDGNGQFNLNKGGTSIITSGPSPIDFTSLRMNIDSETLTLAASSTPEPSARQSRKMATLRGLSSPAAVPSSTSSPSPRPNLPASTIP